MMNREANMTNFDESILSDLFKDAYGFRPKDVFWDRWAQLTDAQKQSEWEYLCRLSDEAVEEEQAQQQRSIKYAEEAIAKVLETVIGSTRKDAIRFLIDAYNADDQEELEWKLGVPFGYFKRTA
jgi:hypothetical protein